MFDAIGGQLTETEQPVGLILWGDLKQGESLRQPVAQFAHRLQGCRSRPQPVIHIGPPSAGDQIRKLSKALRRHQRLSHSVTRLLGSRLSSRRISLASPGLSLSL